MLARLTLLATASLLIAVPWFGQVDPSPIEEGKLTASDAAAGDYFGSCVAVSGDTVLVGAIHDAHAGGISAGSAYVFVRSGTTWSEQAKLTASDAAADDFFGFSVALSGDTAVVGATGDDHAGGVDVGSAYVFTRSGTVWTQQAKLAASDGAANDRFGYAVALSGDTVVIGAAFDSTAAGTSAGSAYVFVRNGTLWTEQAKLTAADASATCQFGYSVAASGDTVLVGADQGVNAGGITVGAAYVFVRRGTVWTQQAKLTASDAAGGDSFGVSVAAAEDTAVIGAYTDDHVGGTDAGSAYVFVRSGTSWSQQAKLTASDRTDSSWFGFSVALSGATTVIGAAFDDTHGGTDAGSAYVFMRSGTTWTQRARLTASDAAAADEFGRSVSVSGDTTVLGAPLDDHAGGTEAGSAYVFRLEPIGIWSDLGLGLAGSSGVPALAGMGYLLPETPVTLSLANAKPFSIAPLVVGISLLNAPFKGGVLVPTPNLIFPLFSDFFGAANFGGPWPPGVPSGLSTYFQWWIQDPTGPKGYAASNAISGTTP